MFADYIKLILRDYQKKSAQHALSSRLSLPTTAKLREACMEVLSNGRCSQKDARILGDVFGGGNDPKAILDNLENYKADKLKPLLNFINGRTKLPDTRVVDLLACLIDFEPRPFELGKSYKLIEGEMAIAAEEKSLEDENKKSGGGSSLATAGQEAEPEDAGKEEQPVDLDTTVEPPKKGPIDERPMEAVAFEVVSPKSGFRFKARNAAISVIVLGLVGGVIYWGIKNKAAPIPMGGRFLQGGEACMYWTGDHYQQISCSRKPGDTLVVALDVEKLRSFKKITRPDTITKKSKGAVWYVKINGKIEFYTSAGYHPIDPQLRLKPITDYMIKNHIRPDME